MAKLPDGRRRAIDNCLKVPEHTLKLILAKISSYPTLGGLTETFERFADLTQVMMLQTMFSADYVGDSYNLYAPIRNRKITLCLFFSREFHKDYPTCSVTVYNGEMHEVYIDDDKFDGAEELFHVAIRNEASGTWGINSGSQYTRRCEMHFQELSDGRIIFPSLGSDFVCEDFLPEVYRNIKHRVSGKTIEEFKEHDGDDEDDEYFTG